MKYLFELLVDYHFVKKLSIGLKVETPSILVTNRHNNTPFVHPFGFILLTMSAPPESRLGYHVELNYIQGGELEIFCGV